MTTTKLLEKAIRNVTTPRGREFVLDVFKANETTPADHIWWPFASSIAAIRLEYQRLRSIKRGKRGMA